MKSPYRPGSTDLVPFRLKKSAQTFTCQPPVSDMKDIGSYLRKKLNNASFTVGWFYSPAFVDVLNELDFETVVYDCMDELTLFKGASPHLLEPPPPTIRFPMRKSTCL
ncbi:hypothetical protein [Kaistella faecalis]|uniref:hypothetical protein n=1 Tax=Kaistella faecalis TaxID=2852098 RepID=UPI001C4666F9|nr:hypothetical protein [Chryseobacterium faecale]UFK97776.1 hypothetical protein LL667_00120 [Chryseobacterium faecale]